MDTEVKQIILITIGDMFHNEANGWLKGLAIEEFLRNINEFSTVKF